MVGLLRRPWGESPKVKHDAEVVNAHALPCMWGSYGLVLIVCNFQFNQTETTASLNVRKIIYVIGRGREPLVSFYDLPEVR